MSDMTYACSLDTGDLAGRRADWAALEADLVERRRDGGRLTRVFTGGRPEVIATLRRLVEAERECCPFLRMTVREEDGLACLDVEAPPGAEELLSGFETAGAAG